MKSISPFVEKVKVSVKTFNVLKPSLPKRKKDAEHRDKLFEKEKIGIFR
jgi:hypothetical protein